MCFCQQRVSVGINVLLPSKIHHFHVVDCSTQRNRPVLKLRNVVQRVSRILAVAIYFVPIFH